jgi:hypothetical protein
LVKGNDKYATTGSLPTVLQNKPHMLSAGLRFQTLQLLGAVGTRQHLLHVHWHNPPCQANCNAALARLYPPCLTHAQCHHPQSNVQPAGIPEQHK